jgi:teichuronic acid biosynthesis glycosyltransferase TuaC
MRVLWTHNFNPDIPNAGRFMHIMAEGLRREGVDLELMYLGALGSLSRIRAARQEVIHRSKSFDITHSQFGSACSLVTAAASGIKVVSLRGSDWHRYRGSNSAQYLHGIIAVLFTRMALNSYDGVIVMSHRMGSEVQMKLQPHALLQVLTDPVDTTIFVPDNRNDARRKLGASEDSAPWVLFTTLSENNPIKRTGLARRSVELAAQTIPGIKLKVATGLAHEQMPSFIAACNVVLCTSTHEGWPNSIKEALACGLPFVSTDVSDLDDIAQKHRGCFVGPADAHFLSDAIIQSLSNEPEPGLRDIAQSMNLETTSKKLVVYYSELLKSSKKVK